MRPFDIPIAIVLLILFGWYVYRHVKRYKEHNGQQEVAESMAE